MSARAAAWVAWSLCALSFVLAMAGVALFFQSATPSASLRQTTAGFRS